jgi:hypothetical protein
LADPPGIGISKMSEDANKKEMLGGFFGNCLRSDAKAANKIYRVWSLVGT